MNSAGTPLTSRSMAGMGQGLSSRLMAASPALASFRSSWQSQLESFSADSDSSANSVIEGQPVRTSSASTTSSTLGDQRASRVAGGLGFSRALTVESPTGLDVARAGKRTIGSKVPTPLISPKSKNPAQALTGAAVNGSQGRRYVSTDGVRTSMVRKSAVDDRKTSQTADVLPGQSSMTISPMMAGTLDALNQRQPNFDSLKNATSKDARDGVGDEHLDLGIQSSGSASIASNPSNGPGHIDREIDSGAQLPALPIGRGSSPAAERAETPAIVPEQAALQPRARGLGVPPTSGKEAAIQTTIAPQNEIAASDFSALAGKSHSDSIASSSLEASANVAGAGGRAFVAQVGAVRAQAQASGGASIKAANHPDQASLFPTVADPTGTVDETSFSIESTVSVAPPSMPATADTRSNQGIQAPITTAADPTAVLMQFSASAIQLNAEPQLVQRNDLQPISELPGALKPGNGKGARVQIPTAPGSASGEPASSAFTAHATSPPANVSGSDAMSLARDTSSVQATNGTAVGVGTSPAHAQGASTSHQTFAALDSTDIETAPNWVHAGARHAEAGFEDPALGWIGVRADQSGGGVHALVVPATAEAAQALGSQMAGLNAHLAESHTPVASLSLGSLESREGGAASDQGFNQSAGQNHAQSNSQDPYVSSAQINGVSSNVASAVLSAPTASPGLPDLEARHISVMA